MGVVFFSRDHIQDIKKTFKTLIFLTILLVVKKDQLTWTSELLLKDISLGFLKELKNKI